jgi:hypothetical protein
MWMLRTDEDLRKHRVTNTVMISESASPGCSDAIADVDWQRPRTWSFASGAAENACTIGLDVAATSKA